MIKFVAALLVVFSCGKGLAQDPSADCFARLKGDDRIQSLIEKFPFDMSKAQSLEILANPMKAAAKDKAALSIWMSEGDRCAELGTDWRRKNYPASINALGNTYEATIKSAIADLYVGKLTFGEVAKIRAKEYAELQIRISVEVEKLQLQRADAARQRELADKQMEEQQKADSRRALEQQEYQRNIAQQQAARAEAARKQAILQYELDDMLMNQKPTQVSRPLVIPPMPKRVTTDCVRNGNYTNCTTR